VSGVSETTNNTAEAGDNNTEQQGESEGKEFEAITSQEDLDRILTQRLARERSKYADYNDLKARAAKLAELEEAQKTAEQKAAERLEAAERKAAELEAKATRAEVAAETGVPAGLLAGATREELEASAAALLAFKGATNTPKPDPSQGAKGKQGSASTADQFARFLEDNLNS
jgi:hypothetical protein